jgi:sugar-phosphatase
VKPAALLLDLDGTLVDSEPLHRRGYRAFFAAQGWELPDLSMFTGRRAEDVFATEPGPWTGMDLVALTASIWPFVPDDPPQPVTGARSLVEAAVASGIRLAVVTSAGPDWVERSLGGELDVLRHVEVVVSAHDVVDGKPDPAGYRLACELLGVPATSAAAVEDSPAGVRAALGAGIDEVYAVSTTHAVEELAAAGATEVFPDLLELALRFGAC